MYRSSENRILTLTALVFWRALNSPSASKIVCRKGWPVPAGPHFPFPWFRYLCSTVGLKCYRHNSRYKQFLSFSVCTITVMKFCTVMLCFVQGQTHDFVWPITCMYHLSISNFVAWNLGKQVILNILFPAPHFPRFQISCRVLKLCHLHISFRSTLFM